MGVGHRDSGTVHDRGFSGGGLFFHSAVLRAGLRVFKRLVQFSELFIGHADTVIGNSKHNVFFTGNLVRFLPGHDDDRSLAGVFLEDAVEKSIFNDRLQDQLWNAALHDLIRHINDEVDFIVKSHIL